MVIVPLMAGKDPDAQKIFDGLFAFFRKFPSLNNADLMDWEVHADCSGPPDKICMKGGTCDLGDSATDGDLDIAFGLLLAHAQWGSAGGINYLAEAKKVITALSSHVTNKDTHLVLMGDWADAKADYYSPRYDGADGPYGGAEKHSAYYFGTRPSDFTLDHFKAFGAATGDASWTAVVDATYTLIANLQTKFAATTGLLPDFVVANTVASAAPAKAEYLEGPQDGAYGFNACRVPWRIGTDYLATGEPRAKAAVDKMVKWVKTKNTYGSFTLAGAAGEAGSQEFEAPWGVAAMADPANQAFLDKIYTSLISAGPKDYYGGSIAMLSLLVMSGNWFHP
jgi:endo-1,4-beta-D-glucanase Y